MQSIVISRRKLSTYKALVKGRVYRHHSNIYKINTASKPVLDILDANRNTPKSIRILLPEAYMYTDKEKKHFLGYKAKYYKHLMWMQEAFKKGIIDKQTFFKELFAIIEYLNRLDLSYWDFHDCNIVVKDKHVFLLDTDDMRINPNNANNQYQRSNLTEFMLHSILGEYIDLEHFIKEDINPGLFTKESMDYMRYATSITTDNILPNCILEELSDPERVEYISKRLKK